MITICLTIIIVALIVAVSICFIAYDNNRIKNKNANTTKLEDIKIILIQVIELDKKENYLAAKPYIELIKLAYNICDGTKAINKNN